MKYKLPESENHNGHLLQFLVTQLRCEHATSMLHALQMKTKLNDIKV